MSVTTRSLLAFCFGAIVLAGCAEEQPAINRVQPDYYEKSFFVGADFASASDDPEFYSQGTLIDVGYGAAQDGLFTSTYAQPLTRVKWTVTEDWLIARLAYERIKGSDGKGTGKATNDGIVVAAYPIQKHFDVQRSYNATTGEQINVIEENASDRPWFERQFIRVDWSSNHSTDNYDYDTLSMLGIYGGVSYEPMAFYENDPRSENRPTFSPDEGYLDITNKAFARPQLVDISHFGWGLGVVPACWFDADFMGGAAPAASCSPVELTIRQSFYRVDKRHPDYEPQDWDGYRFQSFGAFTTDRQGYARNYGMTDTQKHRMINRYNVWDRNHFHTNQAELTGAIACFTPKTTPVGMSPHRDEDADGTEDECKDAGSGSRCDEFTQKCTLPFRKRQAKTIAWYYSNGSAQEYFDATADATHEWDVAFRAATQSAKYAECQATGGTNCAAEYPVYYGQQAENDDAVALAKEVDDCRHGLAHVGANCEALADSIGAVRGYSSGVIALAKMPEAIVFCHSPVEARDPSACAPENKRLPAGMTAARCDAARTQGEDLATIATCDGALNARRGDLRYHLVNAIKAPQTPSPWGIMVDSNDPLTGETVASSINIWTHVNDLFSEGIIDTARYIKGELTTADITEGTYVQDWAKAAEAASTGGALPLLSRADLRAEMAHFHHKSVPELELARDQFEANAPELKREAQKLNREIAMTVRADSRATSAKKPTYEARRKQAIGSATEAALTTPMMQSYAGMEGMPNSDVMMNFASPLRMANPNVANDLRRMKQEAWSDRGACMLEAPTPFAMVDMARVLEEKFGKFDKTQSKNEQAVRAERMRKWLAQRAHSAVIAHEMGHSVGLRHNFVSSSDAWNYRPQYWQLRTQNGKNTTECADLTPDGSCVGPRYFDPITQQERDGLITMWMQSSAMEYPGEVLQDLIGLGAYDFAAAKMFYGDTASVLFDDRFKVGTPRGTGALEKLDAFGGILGFQPSIGTGDINDPTSTRNIHYSALQKNYDLIYGCNEVDPSAFKPADWNDDADGIWHPTVDGFIVQVDGKYSRCNQQPVDYMPWRVLRDARPDEVSRTQSGSAIDPRGRPRFPYGFATDRWADLGNLAVYRHDNGADPYETFDFLITQQEVGHIFDNYRRNRATFSVSGASNRTLGRYNAKIRDGAKGLGLYANIYRDFANDVGYDYDTLWPYISSEFFGDNILASNIAFDHFARQMARPESGPHYLTPVGNIENKMILRSAEDAPGNPTTTRLNVPNGATGLYNNVIPGGRPLENRLASNKGEYDAEYTQNAGSYYDKAWSTMLMTESVDNFISSSRRDFLDARYRAVSLADVYPESYRRWLANNLTGDEDIKGAHVEAGTNGLPIVDSGKFPQKGIAWTSWTATNPSACFVGQSNITCTPATGNLVALDSQIGWEQQKFLIAWTLQYLPENQQQHWLNQMNVWEIGQDSDPGFANRIEFHAPNGRKFVAKTFGKEVLFGKTVQRGISARMLEYANTLLASAYDTTPGPDLDGDTKPDWFEATIGADGLPHVKYDPGLKVINPDGSIAANGRPGCNATDNSQCSCNANRACIELQKYESLPTFMRQAMRDYGLADPSMKGIY